MPAGLPLRHHDCHAIPRALLSFNIHLKAGRISRRNVEAMPSEEVRTNFEFLAFTFRFISQKPPWQYGSRANAADARSTASKSPFVRGFVATDLAGSGFLQTFGPSLYAGLREAELSTKVLVLGSSAENCDYRSFEWGLSRLHKPVDYAADKIAARSASDRSPKEPSSPLQPARVTDQSTGALHPGENPSLSSSVDTPAYGTSGIRIATNGGHGRLSSRRALYQQSAEIETRRDMVVASASAAGEISFVRKPTFVAAPVSPQTSPPALRPQPFSSPARKPTYMVCADILFETVGRASSTDSRYPCHTLPSAAPRHREDSLHTRATQVADEVRYTDSTTAGSTNFVREHLGIAETEDNVYNAPRADLLLRQLSTSSAASLHLQDKQTDDGYSSDSDFSDDVSVENIDDLLESVTADWTAAIAPEPEGCEEIVFEQFSG
ncbi:hypothetical protein EMMF5_002072 [Cystobasidiomycetes sp. EMM_F5]